jgi:hypothetical protein
MHPLPLATLTLAAAALSDSTGSIIAAASKTFSKVDVNVGEAKAKLHCLQLI